MLLCNTGRCYEYGKGVTKDVVKAVEYYTQSANQGNYNGQFSAGILIELRSIIDSFILVMYL